jgi:hypothetical protein
MYVAVFPHLRPWLSERASEALAAITAVPEYEGEGETEAARTMQAAGARFLPQVYATLCPETTYLLLFSAKERCFLHFEQHKACLLPQVYTSSCPIFLMSKHCLPCAVLDLDQMFRML